MELCLKKFYLNLSVISFSLFTIVQYTGVLGRIEYNTISEPPLTRVTKHVPRVISKNCLLLPQHGPCRANIEMYYYDTEEKNCTRFTWGGCQGNGNRFDSRKECMSFCVSTANMTVKRPNYCELSFGYGYCFGSIKRWYYDKFWKVCKETIYSGCGGNFNRFTSRRQCEEACRFKGYSTTPKTTTGSIKKYLIINPYDTTAKRGLNQDVTDDPKNKTKCKDGKNTTSKTTSKTSSETSSSTESEYE